MIAKGTPHANGAVLARYLVTGKDGERAELSELRGFATSGIVDAFRSVHVMARGTKCEAPFFHVYVRNPEGETLDRAEWEYAANCIERILGLTDQPRAIAFHIAESTGQIHMHVAWSRIDADSLTAKPLPFFKRRLKTVSRAIEKRLGLTVVPNQRASSIKYAPTRAEEEQARRLGTNIHKTREIIRNCFERADCGGSFQSALAQAGLILARGTRRDFLVVDCAGGLHALGKRVLGVSAAELRTRLADLPRDSLPAPDEARSIIQPQSVVPHAELSASPPARYSLFVPVRESATVPLVTDSEAVRRFDLGQCLANGFEGQLQTPPVTAHFELAGLPTTRPKVSVSAIERAEATDIDDRQSARIIDSDPYNPDVPDAWQETKAGSVERDHFFAPAPSLKQGPSVAAEHSATVYPPQRTETRLARVTGSIRSLFRAAVKALTQRLHAPQPQKTRRKDETAKGFKAAARSLFRRVTRLPLLYGLHPTWDTFTWLKIWEYDNPAGMDDYGETAQNTGSDFSPHP